MGLILLAMVSWFFGIMMSVAQDLPALENREQYKHAQNSVVLDRNGEQLATLTSNDRRILVPSEDISQTVKQAVVAVEDQRFYEHRGIDFQGIGRAIVQDVLQQNTVQGASTITQQFVKNALRAQGSRTVFQKLREAALAYHLERRWSKDKILTEYLNSIYFGEGAYGIEAAAQTYFGWNHPGCGGEETRCASVLAPEEAALLAGMISSPSAYSPRANPEAATERRNLVLDRMVDQGVLTPEQYTELAGDGTENSGVPIPRPGQIEPPAENSQSPYFTTWLRQQVVDRYGAGEAFGGGLQITVDARPRVPAGGRGDRVQHAGGDRADGVRRRDRQPDRRRAGDGGEATITRRSRSTSRRTATASPARRSSRSPSSARSRTVTRPTRCSPRSRRRSTSRSPGYKKPQLFEVHNYEDHYLGSASIATATQYSDNSVFAELGLQVGPERIAKTAQEMGIQTKVSTNPAMILGGLETGVSPLEMAYAYSTLGRSGARIGGTMDSVPGSGLGPLGIMKVTTRDDAEETVDDKTGSSGENDVQTDQVLDPAAADTSVDLLENVVSGGTGENAATGDFAWGKTGTTDDNGDAWFCGGTEDITACVWVGHPNDVTPMETEYAGGPVDGGTYPADIWHDVVLAYDSIDRKPTAEDEDGLDDGHRDGPGLRASGGVDGARAGRAGPRRAGPRPSRRPRRRRTPHPHPRPRPRAAARRRHGRDRGGGLAPR